MGDDWLDERADEENVAEDEERIEDEGVTLLLKEVEVSCVGAGRETGGGETDSASWRAWNGEGATIMAR